MGQRVKIFVRFTLRCTVSKIRPNLFDGTNFLSGFFGHTSGMYTHQVAQRVPIFTCFALWCNVSVIWTNFLFGGTNFLFHFFSHIWRMYVVYIVQRAQIFVRDTTQLPVWRNQLPVWLLQPYWGCVCWLSSPNDPNFCPFCSKTQNQLVPLGSPHMTFYLWMIVNIFSWTGFGS